MDTINNDLGAIRLQLLRDLVNWERTTGGWEAPIWERVKKHVEEHDTALSDQPAPARNVRYVRFLDGPATHVADHDDGGEAHDAFAADGEVLANSDRPDIFVVEGPETATILAALRFYQEHGQGDPANRSEAIHAIATNDGDVISLDGNAINVLCEAINLGERTITDQVFAMLTGGGFALQARAQARAKIKAIVGLPAAEGWPQFVIADEPNRLWTHIFGVYGEHLTRFVYSVGSKELLALQIRRTENNAWRSATLDERNEVKDSLENANSWALEDPMAWGLLRASAMPEWAIEEHKNTLAKS